MNGQERLLLAHAFVDAVSLSDLRPEIRTSDLAPITSEDLHKHLNDYLTLSLKVEGGLHLGVAVKSDKIYAGSDHNILGPCSISIACGDSIYLIYLFEACLDDHSVSELRCKLMEQLAVSADTTVLPLPGFGNCDLAREDDAELLQRPLIRHSRSFLLNRLAEAPKIRRRRVTGRQGDALLLGEFSDPDFLSRNVTIGLSKKGREARHWRPVEMTCATFLRMFCHHEIGPKDGKAFLQGEPIEGERRAASMKQNYILGLDIDNGTELEPVISQVASEGYTAAIYTTNSHMKPQSEIAEATFLKFCRDKGWSSEATPERVGTFMLENGKITEALSGTITSVEREHLRGGVKIIVAHAPMPRFRLVYLLSRPYVFAERGGSHAEAMQEWTGRVRGRARGLGLAIDESCTDPSRLFYTPRHLPGADYFACIVQGDLLDIETLPLVQSASSTLARSSRAASRLEDRPVSKVPARGRADRGLRADLGKTLQVADLFRASASERIRADKGDKLEVECPFDASHSNPGDRDDRACMVMNASDNPNGVGMVFACQHNACKGVSRMQMLNEAVQLGWLHENDLADPQYLYGPRDMAAPGPSAAEEPSGAPTRVLLNAADDHTHLLAQTLAGLHELNREAPRLFSTPAGAVRVLRDRHGGGVRVDPLTVDTLRMELTKCVSFQVTRGNQSFERRLPDGIVRDILAMEDPGLPVLRAVVNTPVFVRSGSSIQLLDRPGYHASSGLFYEPGDMLRVPPVPQRPSAEDLERAKELLFDNVLYDFPFDDSTGGSASRAHVLALLLQFFIRDLIDGPTPIFFVTKPMAGTGAGLLIDSILQVTTGAPGEAQTESASEEERRKSVTSALLNGSTYFYLDNINQKLDSSAYASAATSERWRDRLLGRSQMVNVSVRLTWIFAGNNVSASNELTRRFVPIRLDAKSDPLARTQFKHPDLRSWTKAHRGELVWACLTIVQYWLSVGMPHDASKPLPSYEAWSAVFRGLLGSIGGTAFLGNLDLLSEGVNEEMDAWSTFITIWAQEHGLGIKRPVGNPDARRDQWSGEHSLVALVTDNSLELPIRGHDGVAQAKSLSYSLRSKADNVFSIVFQNRRITVALRRERDPNLNMQVYWLEQLE